MTVFLKNLYFGFADGNTESNEKNFLNLFYTGNNKYDEFVNNKMKFIITGQKGTGKTILGRYIEEKCKSQNIKCKIFNKNDITLMKLIEKNNDVLSNDEAIPFFKWIIYFEIYELLKNTKFNIKFGLKWFEEKKRIKIYKKSMKNLKKIYTERYPRGNFEINEILTSDECSINSQIAIDKLFETKIKGYKKNRKDKTNKRKEFYKVLNEIEELILTCLNYKSVILILDDLDEIDINTDTDLAPLMTIKKLIDAFKDVNTLLLKNNLTPSRCIMLLRSDILSTLNKHSSNLNKILLDNTIDLYWITKDEKSPEKHILMEMILNKIKCCSNEYKNYDNKTLYLNLFPKDINGDSTLKFLIDNSFGRPRDIICYLDVIKTTYPNEIKFKENMFRKCRQAYSQKFLYELYNEMNLHLKLKVVENYLSLIRKYGRNTFYCKDIKRFYKQHKKSFKYITNMDECLENLYNFGVLGNSWKINKGKPNESTQYSWGYRKDGNPTVDMDRRFTVHYGLRKALNTN